MANTKISDLTEEITPPAATDHYVAAQEDITNTKVPVSMITLEHESISTDAVKAMEVGKLYKVDMSAWTGDHIFSLPTTAKIGEKIGIYIVTGHATHRLQIRTTATSNDTIDGTDYDSTDWGTLFSTGEYIVFQCIIANTAWMVENIGGSIISSMRLVSKNDPANPTLSFGLNSGFYESADDTISVSINGVKQFLWTGVAFGGNASGSGRVLNETTSSTNPVLTIQGDLDTGLGSAGADQLSLIAGASEGARVDFDSTAGNTRFMLYDVDNGTLERVTVGVADSGGGGYKVLRIPN